MAGSDRESSRLMAFLCSVIRDLVVFEVSPMYTLLQSWQGIMYTTLRLSRLLIWSLCLVNADFSLFVGF